MSAQVYPVPGQTEGGKKAFLEWTSRYLFSYLSLTCGSNVNYYKNVHHPILTLSDGIDKTQAVFKANQYAFLSIEYPGMFSSRGGDHIARLPSRTLGCHKRWKVPPFVKFETILAFLCFLLDPVTNKHSRTWISMINLWIDSKTCQKKTILLSASLFELLKENVLGDMMLSYWPCFTWKFFMIWLHKVLKLIFERPPSSPKNITTLEKTT